MSLYYLTYLRVFIFAQKFVSPVTIEFGGGASYFVALMF